MCVIQTLFYQREGEKGKRGKGEKMAFKGERVKR